MSTDDIKNETADENICNTINDSIDETLRE